MASRPTSAKRNRKQKVKARYAKAREEAQLEGVIPTSPEGAVRDERVNPASQSEQQFPELAVAAARRGWATPEEKKPRLVDEIIGIVESGDADHKAKVAAFRALGALDKHQYERDNPEEVAKRNAVNPLAVSTTVNVVNTPTDFFARLLTTATEPMPDPLAERIRQDQQEGTDGTQRSPEVRPVPQVDGVGPPAHDGGSNRRVDDGVRDAPQDAGGE